MYRDHSMQNLNSYQDSDEHLNRGVFAEKMTPSNGNRKGITGNIRGRVKNKYRDLFASSEDIFGNQEYKQQQPNQQNRLSVKYKSAHNLAQTNDDRSYYADVQQLDKLDKYRNDLDNSYEYETYPNEYDPNYNYNQVDYNQTEYNQPDYNQTDYNQAYYQQEQLANNQTEDDQYDEETENNQVNETTKQNQQLLFVPKNQPTHLLVTIKELN